MPQQQVAQFGLCRAPGLLMSPATRCQLRAGFASSRHPTVAWFCSFGAQLDWGLPISKIKSTCDLIQQMYQRNKRRAGPILEPKREDEKREKEEGRETWPDMKGVLSVCSPLGAILSQSAAST